MDDERNKTILQKAGRLLAHRSYSRGELRVKLSQTADELLVEAALIRLEQLNLLNDADYAYNFALNRIKQEGWSSAKVSTSLLRRYIDPKTIESALERIREEIGYESSLLEYIDAHCRKQGTPTDPIHIRKLLQHLRRRGFEENEIFRVLKQKIPAEILRHFETGE
jgi:regulatory protein